MVFESLLSAIGFNGALALLFFIAAILLLLIAAPAASWLGGRIPYIFSASLIRCEEGRLLSDEKIIELAEAGSLPAAVGALEGTDYAKYLALGEDLELGLQVYLSHVHRDFLELVPGRAKDFLETFVRMRWDVEIIKHSLVEKYSGAKILELPEDFTAVASLPREIVRSLEEAGSISEVIAGLEKTEYVEILKEASKHWERTGLISAFINPLHAYYFEKCAEKAALLKGEDKASAELLLGIIVDINNLKTLFRLRQGGASMEELEKHARRGREIYGELGRSFLESDVHAMLEQLVAQSKHAIFFTRAIRAYDEKKSLAEIERFLDLLLLEKARELSASQPFGLGVLFGYIIQKEIEIKNVKSLIYGLKARMSYEDIKRQLVSEAA